MITADRALETLNKWFEKRGSQVTGSTIDAWNITEHEDAWVFSPGGGRRTNRLYMVRNDVVIGYSPSEESTKEAYPRLRYETSQTFGRATADDVAGFRRGDLPDGTYYYLEDSESRPFSNGPAVMRTTLVDGLPQDEHWDLRRKEWTRSPSLVPYRTGRGQHVLFRAPESLALHWVQETQNRWDTEHQSVAASSDGATSPLKGLLNELQSFPAWSGISFRGMSAVAEFGRTANTAVSGGLVATSRDPRVATENFTTPGVYAVMGTDGRGIESVSRHPKEFEVLFLPGTTFGIVGTIDVDGYPVTLVHQTKLSADTLDLDMTDFESRARNAVASGRAGHPVEITSPRKYVGDID